MKYIFFIFFLNICNLLQGQDYCSPNLWQNSKIIVDGKNNEWQQPFKYYNASASLRFSIANDSTHLYLCFETYEPYNIVKMLRAGWLLQLSSKERKKRINMTIDFMPIMIELTPKHDYTETKTKEEPTFKNWLDDYNLAAGTYTTRGFKESKKGKFQLKDTTNIRIALDYNSTKTVYEIAIPLTELFDVKQLDLTEQMKLKVSLEKIDAPSEKGKLSIGTDGFSSINGRNGRNHIANSESDPVVKEPVDLTKGNPKSRLYHKANFSHDFYLISKP